MGYIGLPVLAAFMHISEEGQMSMIVYQCEDSLESIFTAIYNAYEEKRDHSDTRISLNQELMLFAEYILVKADDRKAVKVIRTLKRRFGEKDYLTICNALSSPDDEKGQAVYQTVVKGLARNAGQGHLFDNLADDDVNKVFALARGAGNEKQHLFGFLRFQELENGILYSRIGPKYNLLTFLMPHFADRFPMENFMIYDDQRNLFGIHPKGRDWYLVHGAEFPEAAGDLRLSEQELKYQELFRYFCHRIAIKERENPRLQRNMLPLRFQEYMIEFDKKC